MSKILVVDDEPNIIEAIEENLKREGYQTVRAHSGEEALAMMPQEQPDLVLLDLTLPGMDGYEVCRQMQQDVRLIHIPVIMLTARSSTPDKVMGYQKGADDYITKPFDADELLVRVRSQLHHLYHEDVSELTGLPGSQAVEDAIQGRTESAEQPWSIVYIDIDRFTDFNETFSYIEGDEMIRTAATILREVMDQEGNGSDFLGHEGGDDFVIITTPERTKGLIETATTRFNQAAPDFYPPDARTNGYIMVTAHDGKLDRSPLVSLAFDVVDNQPLALTDEH